MNVRKDISSLFLDVVNYMQTDNLDLKKLMDFYLMNCIMSQLDMATWLSIALWRTVKVSILSFGAWQSEPWGALRCTRLQNISLSPSASTWRINTLMFGKQQQSMWHNSIILMPNGERSEISGFFQDIIADSNPMVVGNAITALSEISESHPNSNLHDLNSQNNNKLPTALNECTEWGQVFILDCLFKNDPKKWPRGLEYLWVANSLAISC